MPAPDYLCQRLALAASNIASALTFVAFARKKWEDDPLFFKVQRGEATTEEWLTKVAEIKMRYPYPV